MRRIVLPAALLLLLSAASPAFASAGLPKIATIQVGSHSVAVHGDSPMLHTGTNTLTVEIAGLSSDHTVRVSLVDPSGKRVAVPLSDLTVLSGPDGGHDSATMSHDTAAAGHDMAGMDHGTASGHDTAAAGHDSASAGHDAAAASEGYNARGKTSLDQVGAWKLVVEVTGHDQTVSAQTDVDVKQGGPSRVYLGFTGLLMGGTLVYGAVQRRRQDKGR